MAVAVLSSPGCNSGTATPSFQCCVARPFRLLGVRDLYSLMTKWRDVDVNVRFHATVIVIVILVFVAAVVADVRNDGRVVVALFPDLPMPEVCMSRVWFQTDCPACGLTRSFIFLAKSELAKSIAMHRFGWLVALFFAAQVPYRLVLLRRIRKLSPDSARARWPRFVTGMLLVSILLNWVLKLAGH